MIKKEVINDFKKGVKWTGELTPEMLQFEDETGKYAIYNGKITGNFEYWLHHKKVPIKRTKNPIAEFIANYIKEHTYFTAETFTIYYIIEKLKERNIVIEKDMYRSIDKYYSDYPKISIAIRRELRRLKGQGKIQAYSRKAYKVKRAVMI